MSLNKKLKSLKANRAISLHVPGHHNNTIGNLKDLNLDMDMTEITGLDDLHQPESCIKTSMEQMDRYPGYSAQYLVNGTTVGILSTIYAVAHLEGEILIPRNAHKSIYNGLSLTQQKTRWMAMTVSSKTKEYDGVKGLEQLDLSKVKLAIFTYPNYYGETFEIEKCIKILKEHNIPILVDEAHGAHFGISSYFPKSSLEYQADIVVQSYHKTLPALTMGSVIYIKNTLEFKHIIQEHLSMLQSSSPSYLIMSSLEYAEEFYKQYNDEKFQLNRNLLIKCLESKGFTVGRLTDPLKLIVSQRCLSGFAVQNIFEKANIYVELSNHDFVLLVLPLWDISDHFPFDELLQRIQNFNLNINEVKSYTETIELPTDSIECSIGKLNNLVTIPIEQAIGSVSGTNIIPYPPGIPVILKGELITKEVADSLLQWIESGGRVEGIINKQIKVKGEE